MRLSSIDRIAPTRLSQSRPMFSADRSASIITPYVRGTFGFAMDPVPLSSPERVAEANEDVAAYVNQLQRTWNLLDVDSVKTTTDRTKQGHQYTVVNTALSRRDIINDTINTEKYDGQRQAFQRQLPKSLTVAEADRVTKREFIRRWDIEKTTHPKQALHPEGEQQWVLTPSYMRSPADYCSRQRFATITIKTVGKQAPVITYQPPKIDYNFSTASPVVPITDPKLQKSLLTLAQRLDDRASGVNIFQRIHRLAKYGYWTP